MILIVAVTGFCFSSSVRAGGDWALTNSQFQTRQIKLQGISAQGLLVAQDGEGSIIGWDDVLDLTAQWTQSVAAAGKFNLYLSGGDHLSGEPVNVADEKLEWTSPSLGDIQIPLSRLVGISTAGAAPDGLDESRTDDLVRLANGDSVHGIVTQIGASGVTLQAGDATPTLGWETMKAVLFSTAPQPLGSNRRTFRVRFAGDAAISAVNITLSGDKLTLNLDDKTARQVSVSSVIAIEQLNGPVSWLTARSPSENIYKPMFSENFPTRFDRTVGDGQPIREKFPAFHHGIGCHSYSKLVYDLNGNGPGGGTGYAGFRTQFAIDSDSPLADVTVRILLDDKVTVEQKNVKAGMIYPVVIVGLGAAKKLALEVDYGKNYATEDRFVWLDPALIRTVALSDLRNVPPTTAPSSN